MKRILLSLAFSLFFLLHTFCFINAQSIGIGTNTPNVSAQLDVASTNKGFLAPRLTLTQRNGITSPAAGLIVYCMDCGNGEMQFFNGSEWLSMKGGNATISVPSITLGGNQWSNKNLDVVVYRNGDSIPQVTDPTLWASLTTGAWCWYNNDPTNNSKYGKLYNWYAVNDSRGLAPRGWHVATESDWNKLIKSIDPLADTTCGDCSQSTTAGGAMKSTSNLWASPNTGATNSSGFDGLPGGFRNNNGSFNDLGISGLWWSSKQFDQTFGFNRFLGSGISNAISSYNNKARGFSVRIVKDPNELPAASLSAFNCAGVVNNGTLLVDVPASGVSSSISYTGGNGGIYPAQSVISNGVRGLTAIITAGTLNNGNGNLTCTITGTPSTSGNASFIFIIGGQTCTINRLVAVSTSANYRDDLPAAIGNTAKIVAIDWKFLQNWMGYWARSGSYSNDREEETYLISKNFPFVNNPWIDLYKNNSSYQFIQNLAAATGDGFYEAICRIMKVHNFQLLTDIYGNIPYSEALTGANTMTPKYDNGLDIYKDLFRELDKAIALLKDPTASSTTKNQKIAINDLVFKGDALKWRKFANTLKLRLLVHAYNVPEINLASEAAIIQAEGSGFLQIGETAKINPGYSSSNPNPFYKYYAINENGVPTFASDLVRANSYAVGFGDSFNLGYYNFKGDPRLDKFYIKPDINPDPAVYQAAEYHKGIFYGALSGQFSNSTGIYLSSINAINNTSPNIGLTPNGAASDAWILTSVESLFLQAEARERGIINAGPTAKDLLNTAIQESFISLGLTSQDYLNYINSNLGKPDVDYDAGADKIFTILSQKWFALNGIAPFEVWTDYRRTDIVYGGDLVGFQPGPPLSIIAGAATSIPVRLLYPETENRYNSVNVYTQGNVNALTSRVFWDKQ